VKSAILFRTVLLLVCSNAFMTFAWYSHLRNWNDKRWFVAAVLSWGIALFEYLFQVPANRIGYRVLSLPQLKEDLENPSLASAHFRLGNILEKKGDSAGARGEYEVSLKIDPKQKEARAALAKLKR
jgi:uncharacterized protein (DUF486 family)